MSRMVLLLLKLDLLKETRTGILARVFAWQSASVRTAITLKVAVLLLFVSITCLLPLLTLTDFGQVTELGRTLAQLHNLIITGAVIAMFFFGLYAGTSMIHDLTVSENEQLLAYPMILDDLVHYRLSEALLVWLKGCFFIIVPSMLLVFLSMGYSAPWTVLMTILMAAVALAASLIGTIVLLWVAKCVPHIGAEKIFLGIFLISCWAFVIAVRLRPENTNLWEWFDRQFSTVSVLFKSDSLELGPVGLGQLVLGVVAGALVVRWLWRTSVQTLGQAYYRIHTLANDMTLAAKPRVTRLGFANLNSYLQFLPLDIRTLLVKDVIALIREPHLLLKFIGLLLALVWLANIKLSSVSDSFVFVLYCSTALIMSQLFVNAIGRERNNILVIKQLCPSAATYLSTRIKIACGMSLLVLVPFWSVLLGTSADGTVFTPMWRVPLLLLSVLVASSLVTWYSATFAEFRGDRFKKQNLGINPVANGMFLGFGLLLSWFFYRLDLVLLSQETSDGWIVVLIVTGVVLAASTTVFALLGVRRIKRYA